MENSLIFIVDDEPTTRRLISHWAETYGYKVKAFEGGEQCLEALDEGPDTICLDIMMPGLDGIEVLKRIQMIDPELPVIMVTARDSLEVAVEAMRQGAYDYIPKPVDRNRLRSSLKKAVERYSMAKEINRLRKQLTRTYSFDNIVGKGPAMESVFKQIEKVLDNSINVFIQGESGTGKELVARAIHYHGPRRHGPFEAVNCGAIPENLQESELFGHEKGAFTGATQSQVGKVEMAQGGTLFLDEVGEMSPALQIKLLRFLQNKSFERVGGRKEIKIDIRIISATNKVLEREVESGNFREDLYYRLVVYPIKIPPLRDRKDDIPALAHHFLEKYREETGKHIEGTDHRVMEALMGYGWPGNVRELENVIHRGVVTSESQRLQLSNLPQKIIDSASAEETDRPKKGMDLASKIVPMKTLEKRAMLHALNVTKGNLAVAAKELGMGRATFYRKMDKYGLRALSPFLKKEE